MRNHILGGHALGCFRIDGTAKFTLAISPDPPAPDYLVEETFSQGSIFETGRNYLNTHDDELFFAWKEMPASDFR